jgi:ABC-type branched-subunit amino acid transport system substrate-binding protein
VGNEGGDLGVLCGCGPPANGKDFAAAYKAKYGSEPEAYAGPAYDSANLLLEAIAAGADTREKVTERLAAADHQGVMGRYRFTATGELTADSGAFNLFAVTAAGLQYLQTVR